MRPCANYDDAVAMKDLRYVFAFTASRPEVAAFYRDVLGLDVDEAKDDAVWFRTAGARLSVHNHDDVQTAEDVREAHAFVVGIGVDDLEAAYKRSERAGAVVGERFESWFFVRDPDGRFLILAPKRHAHRDASCGSARTLVVINGAIASGKNAVSTTLAALVERGGGRAAVIDLDELWFMLDHQTPRSHELVHWLDARRAAAVLTDEFYRSGRDAVVVNGPFFTQAERTGYLAHLRTTVAPLFVTLRVSFEEAWRRAQGDPRRGLSKQREWLKRRHAESERLMAPLFASDLVLDTDGRPPDEIATDIVAALEAPRGSPLQIRFHPESDEPALVTAAAEYQRLWDSQGARIVEQLAAVTGLRFAEGPIDALVVEGVSQSHPLRLRASYDVETKLGTLVHELSHRLIAANRARLRSPLPRSSREEHELIDLFLFDLWNGLFGEAFALRQVEVESRRRRMYREAWIATLAMDRSARQAKLLGVLGQ